MLSFSNLDNWTFPHKNTHSDKEDKASKTFFCGLSLCLVKATFPSELRLLPPMPAWYKNLTRAPITGTTLQLHVHARYWNALKLKQDSNCMTDFNDCQQDLLTFLADSAKFVDSFRNYNPRCGTRGRGRHSEPQDRLIWEILRHSHWPTTITACFDVKN